MGHHLWLCPYWGVFVRTLGSVQRMGRSPWPQYWLFSLLSGRGRCVTLRPELQWQETLRSPWIPRRMLRSASVLSRPTYKSLEPRAKEGWGDLRSMLRFGSLPSFLPWNRYIFFPLLPTLTWIFPSSIFGLRKVSCICDQNNALYFHSA